MITQQRIISAFTPKVSPIRIAALCYKKWWSDVPFIDDLDDYMLNGIVISTPYLFAMAKVIDVGGQSNTSGGLGGPSLALGMTDKREPAWFVRMAVGNLKILLANLPCYLPRICFCRRNDGRLRVYDTARLIKLVNPTARPAVAPYQEGT